MIRLNPVNHLDLKKKHSSLKIRQYTNIIKYVNCCTDIKYQIVIVINVIKNYFTAIKKIINFLNTRKVVYLKKKVIIMIESEILDVY